jgi:hypothetical protein
VEDFVKEVAVSCTEGVCSCEFKMSTKAKSSSEGKAYQKYLKDFTGELYLFTATGIIEAENGDYSKAKRILPHSDATDKKKESRRVW